MESEFNDIDQRSAWMKAYEEIQRTSAKNSYTCLEAKKIENKDYNRYRNVSPYDHSRIKLQRSSVDYINASFVKVPEANRAYILTQGPLSCTAGHFWLMIWEQNCKNILMLNKIMEQKMIKCHQYWPDGLSKNELIFENVGLSVKFIERKEASHYNTTKLLLKDMDSELSREITHFNYTTWPDFGVPQSPAEILNFLMVVRQSCALDKESTPAVIHCSAGIGRSGTFCLVDSCLVMCEKSNCILEKEKIKQVLLGMRTYRMGLIQTPEQLRFSYLAISEGAKRFLSSNVDTENNHMIGTLENRLIPNDKDTSTNCTSHKELNGSKEDLKESHLAPPIPPHRSENAINCNLDTNNLVSLSNAPSIDQNNDSLKPKSDHVIFTSSSSCANEESTSSEIICEDSLTFHASKNHPIDLSTNDGDISIDHKSEIPVPNSKVNNQDVSHSDSSLRKRKRHDKIEKTMEKIQEIKKKQKDHEIWQKRRRLLFHPITIGLVAMLGTGIVLYRFL